MFLSLGLIVLHRHDLTGESPLCSTESNHKDHHSHPEDCHYCFLFFQQGIQNVKVFSWQSNPIGFQLTSLLIQREIKFPYLYTQTSKSLRAPPLIVVT